ncbi:outer membrane beta-barrel protein [Helicobacter sp. 23-1045]
MGAGLSTIEQKYSDSAFVKNIGNGAFNQNQVITATSAKDWGVAWEFLVGYKHFLNDWVGFRYYGNIGIQHYQPVSFASNKQEIGFVDYTLNADLLIDFYETTHWAIGMLGGMGFGGTSFDKNAVSKYLAQYNSAGQPIGLADDAKHFFNVNASVGLRAVIFQKIRRTGARVCDDFVNGKRVCRVPIFYIGHNIEINAKFPLLDYKATPNPDVIRANGGGTNFADRPGYTINNPYRITIRYIVDF